MEKTPVAPTTGVFVMLLGKHMSEFLVSLLLTLYHMNSTFVTIIFLTHLNVFSDVSSPKKVV